MFKKYKLHSVRLSYLSIYVLDMTHFVMILQCIMGFGCKYTWKLVSLLKYIDNTSMMFQIYFISPKQNEVIQ
jgi:hypothetical protein